MSDLNKGEATLDDVVDKLDYLVELLQVNMTQQQRMYDVLLTIVCQGGVRTTAGDELAGSLVDAHSKFEFIGSDPWVSDDTEE